MANTKKLATLSLASLFAMGTVLSACSTKEASPSPSASSVAPQASASATAAANTGIDTSKEVKLKTVLLGSKPKAFDEVYGEVNKLLKQKINATLDISFLDWGEYQQKYPLMFAANEDFDLVFSATWSYYAQQATKNGFMPLTEDLIKKFAPKTWAEEPKVAWEQAKINGKIYMIPQNNFEYSYHMIGIRGDLRQKYNLPELKTYDDYVNYLKVISEKEKEFKPSIGVSEFNSVELIQPNEWNFVVPQLPIVYKVTEATGKLFSYVDTPEFATFSKKMFDTQKTGAWSRDAIANKVDKTQAFKDGKLASVEWNLGTLLRTKSEMQTTHPDWKVELYDLSADKKRLSNPFINNGMSIHAGSKNYERALMAIDLLRYDPEIHDLTNYGIKGKHYEPVGKDQFKPLPASADFPPSGTDPWGWNSLNERLDSTVAEETIKFTENWKKTVTVNHPLETFTFDDSKVKNEVAAVSNVMETYGKPLFYGLVDPNDAGHGLQIFKDKLKQAGIDKIVAEMQSQADPVIAKK
jgi:putative aldouronate transport system substrate-binding protein